jgi:hypothetical protein
MNGESRSAAIIARRLWREGTYRAPSRSSPRNTSRNSCDEQGRRRERVLLPGRPRIRLLWARDDALSTITSAAPAARPSSCCAGCGTPTSNWSARSAAPIRLSGCSRCLPLGDAEHRVPLGFAECSDGRPVGRRTMQPGPNRSHYLPQKGKATSASFRLLCDFRQALGLPPISTARRQQLCSRRSNVVFPLPGGPQIQR